MTSAKRAVFFLTACMAAVCLCLCANAGRAVSAADTEERTVVLDACESSNNWTNAVFPDRTNYIVGSSSMISVSPAVVSLNAIFLDLDRSKLPAFEDAYLEMYVFIGSVENMSTAGGGAQIELNSSGINDVDEIFYEFSANKIKLSDGWNYVSLKLTDFSPTDGSFDYSRLMGMRVYSLTHGTTNTLRLDHIILTDAPKIDAVRENGFSASGTKYEVVGEIVDESAYPVSSAASIAGYVLIGVGSAAIAVFAALIVMRIRRGRKHA